MKVINRIKEFADSRGLTAYALWKATNLSEPTVYRLYKDPTLIPSGKVLEGLAEAFPDTTPNDWLRFEREQEEAEPIAPSRRRKAAPASGKGKEKSEFHPGQLVRNPRGIRGWITKLLPDGKAIVDWENQINGDVIPLHLLTAAE